MKKCLILLLFLLILVVVSLYSFVPCDLIDEMDFGKKSICLPHTYRFFLNSRLLWYFLSGVIPLFPAKTFYYKWNRPIFFVGLIWLTYSVFSIDSREFSNLVLAFLRLLSVFYLIFLYWRFYNFFLKGKSQGN